MFSWFGVDFDDWKKIGVGLTIFGILFTVLGVLLFFDRGLIAMGNVLFISGVVLIIGFGRTRNFFFRVEKWKGTVCFLGGMVLVLIGWPVIGIVVEFFGIINLFGDFFPYILRFAKQVPIIGPILRIPTINNILDRIFNFQTLPLSRKD